jgi:hypothetical protein
MRVGKTIFPMEPPANSAALLDANNYLRERSIRDDEFAALIKKVPCKYRVFAMQQCYSGGFIDDLRDDKTVILTSCAPDQFASRADTETEIYKGVEYHHDEFSYHLHKVLSEGNCTMYHAYQVIKANDSLRSEAPQYSGGRNNLGQRLTLAF